VKGILRSRSASGFSLLELLLAMALGLSLFGVVLQALIHDGQNGMRFARVLREKALQRRTLDLVKTDLRWAEAIALDPSAWTSACPLSGRAAVLHLETPAGAITYSVGQAPSSIWRGQVLMRCGPAYGLQGELSASGAVINRVVIDGLDGSAPEPFAASFDPGGGSLRLALHQAFAAGQRHQRIATESVLDLTGVELL